MAVSAILRVFMKGLRYLVPSSAEVVEELSKMKFRPETEPVLLRVDVKSFYMSGRFERLAELGFDPVYGARPLKRAVQRELENPLAQGILSGEFKTGDCIVIDLEGENFSFRSPVVSEAQVA